MTASAKQYRVVSILLLTFIALSRTATAQAQKYDSLYVFGDSLADNGNVLITSTALRFDPAVPPSTSPHHTYFQGRFSNGPIAFEYLWQRLSGAAPGTLNGLKPFLSAPLLGGAEAVDFAFGGTGTPLIDQTPGGLFAPGLLGQIELFRAALRGRKPSNRALFAIVTGANDYRDDPFNEPMDPTEVVQNISDSVVALYELGARDVMVLNLPDLGLLPANSGDPATASALAAVHNTLLAAAMTALEAQLPKLNLFQIDLNQVFALLPPNMNRTIPELDYLFQILPPGYPPEFHMSACLFLDPSSCADVPAFEVEGQQFLFWDIVHPTTAAHYVLGKYLYDSLVH